jgi:hypothetical protein
LRFVIGHFHGSGATLFTPRRQACYIARMNDPKPAPDDERPLAPEWDDTVDVAPDGTETPELPGPSIFDCP